MAPKKDKGQAKGGPGPPPQAAASAQQQPTDRCVFCLASIDARTDDRFEVTCNLCGQASMHYDCAVDYLQQCLPAMFSNSSAQKRYAVLMKQRPKYFYSAENVPCPAGSARAKRDPAAGCAGFTLDAEIYKPVKALPAPAPQPARPAKQQQAAAAGTKAAPTGGGPTGRKQIRAPASSSSSVQAPAQPLGGAAGGGGRPSRPPPFAPGAAGGGGGGSFKGPRPVELMMCREVAEAGRCYIRNCRFAHSEAELREREEEYAAERAARKLEAREAEAAAQRAAAQRALDEAATAQAVLDAIEEREMLLGISQPTLALVKGHKRSACLQTLLSYGFSEAEAENAVEAAGADQRLATQMLFDGQPCTGFQPVTVDREVQDLLTFAAELRLDAPLQAVEDHLAAAGGDWEAAREALQAVALEAAATAATAVADAGSWGDAAWAVPVFAGAPPEASEPAGGLPPSQPGTPNPAAAAPQWAADVHSAGGTTAVASPAVQSPHAPPSEAASDGGASWHQPSSAIGSMAAAPTGSAAPTGGAPGGEAHAWAGQLQIHQHPQMQPQMQMYQQHSSQAGFEGFQPAPQHPGPSPAPFGSPVPLHGALPQLPMQAGHMPVPPTAYAAQLPPAISSGPPSEYDHGFQAGLAAAMRQLHQAQQVQLAQQAQQFAPQAPPYAQHQPPAYAQQEQYLQAYGQQQYQQAYAGQPPHTAQQQYGPPAGQLAGQPMHHQPPSPTASYGQAAALAPDAFFPAAQPQPQPWQQQAIGQPASPHYQQQASATPFQQQQQSWEPAHAVPTPQQAQQVQHAGQDNDDLDAILSLMGIS